MSAKKVAGKNPHSYKKHELVGILVKAQSAKLTHLFGNNGCFIDMHGGDGDGVDMPNEDLFDERSASIPTALLVMQQAGLYGSKAIVCERNKDNRAKLRSSLGNQVTLLKKHEDLYDIDLSQFSWVIVLNDPNGHREHGVHVLEHISKSCKRADFIVCVNMQSLKRHVPFAKNPSLAYHNRPQVRGGYQSAITYEWMLHPEQWRNNLGRKGCAYSKYTVGGAAYQGRIMLIANSIANIPQRLFQWTN